MGDRDNYSFPGWMWTAKIVPEKQKARRFRASQSLAFEEYFLPRHVIALFGPHMQVLVIGNDLDWAILPASLEL
jgi:hypothetical protein